MQVFSPSYNPASSRPLQPQQRPQPQTIQATPKHLDRFDHSGQSPLRFSGNQKKTASEIADAVECGDKRTLRRLLSQSGADPYCGLLYGSSSNHTPMTLAAGKGQADIIRMLNKEFGVSVTAPGKSGETPMTMAAAQGQADIIRMLEEEFGVSVTKPNKKGNTPMTTAAIKRQADIIRMLNKEFGVSVTAPDKNGHSPMTAAAGKGQADTIRMLNKEFSVSVTAPDKNGETPMTMAAAQGQADIIRMLEEEFGVSVTDPDKNGRTPMTAAARMGNDYIIRMLNKEFGVSGTAPDKNGRTPMTVAAAHGEVNVIRTLNYVCEVSVTAPDKKGSKPLDRAKDKATRQCIKELSSKKAGNSKTTAPQPAKTQSKRHSKAEKATFANANRQASPSSSEQSDSSTGWSSDDSKATTNSKAEKATSSNVNRQASPSSSEQSDSPTGWSSDDSKATTVRPGSSSSNRASTLTSGRFPSLRGLRTPRAGSTVSGKAPSLLDVNQLRSGSVLSSAFTHSANNAAETAQKVIDLFNQNILLTAPQGKSILHSLDVDVAVQTGRMLRDSAHQSGSQKSATSNRILEHSLNASQNNEPELREFWKIVEEKFNKQSSDGRPSLGRKETRGTTGPRHKSYIGEDIPPGDFNNYDDYKMARLAKRFAMFQLTLAVGLGIAAIAFPPLIAAAGGVALLNPQVLGGVKYVLSLATHLTTNPASLPEFKKKVKAEAGRFTRFTQLVIDPLRKDKRFAPHTAFLIKLSISFVRFAEKIEEQDLKQCLESTLQFEQETLDNFIEHMNNFGKGAEKKQVHALQEFARKYDKYINELPENLEDMTNKAQLRLQDLVDTARKSPLPELQDWGNNPENLAFNLARLRVVNDPEQSTRRAEAAWAE